MPHTFEQYVNYNASTTVGTAGYTAGSGTLVVTATTSFPTGPNFTVVIVDKNTLNPTVLFRVTGVSGLTYTGTAEGPDASANSGDFVYTVLSSKAIDGIRSDIIQFGSYSAVPANTKLGDLYITQDGPYMVYDQGTASSYIYPGWGSMVQLASANWTAVNTLNVTVTYNQGGVSFQTTVADGDLHGLSSAAPATPYTITFPFTVFGSFGTANVGGIWLGFSNATAYRVIQYYPGNISPGATFRPSVESETWTTTASTGAAAVTTLSACAPIDALQIADNGTNRSYAIIVNNGTYTLSTETNNAGFATTNIAFGIRGNASNLWFARFPGFRTF